MLTKDTRAILKNLTSINSSMIVSSPMYFKDEFSSILGRANIDKIEDIEEEFGIYDMPSFLSALDLLDDPESKLENGIITASDSDTTLKFITTDVSALETAQVNEKVLETTVAAQSEIEFTLGTDLLNKIKKASGVFKTFDTLFINNENGELAISLGAANSFSKNNNSFNVKLDPSMSSDNNFTLSIPLESIQKIPTMQYEFKIKYNPDKDARRIVLENDLFSFLLSLKKV